MAEQFHDWPASFESAIAASVIVIPFLPECFLNTLLRWDIAYKVRLETGTAAPIYSISGPNTAATA
jgi:hypothetical protein